MNNERFENMVNEEMSLAVGGEFSEADESLLSLKLWELMKKVVYEYNRYNSTSITVEESQSLMNSALYTIEMGLWPSKPAWEIVSREDLMKELLTCDPYEMLKKGRKVLESKLMQTKLRFMLMSKNIPYNKNMFYVETLRNMDETFRKYNIEFEADQVPGDIDYWPMLTVSEGIKGISYLDEYIKRLHIESDFIRKFNIYKVSRLYDAYIPDHQFAFFNLCEPILVNAVGLAIIGQDVQELNITDEHREMLLTALAGKWQNELQWIIDMAAEMACQQIGITNPIDVAYFRRAAAGLCDRVIEPVRERDLSGVFLGFPE